MLMLRRRRGGLILCSRSISSVALPDGEYVFVMSKGMKNVEQV